MHQRFADRIAKQLYLLKWKSGLKHVDLAKWLADRFPRLSPEDAEQIREALPINFSGSKK